MCVCVVNCDALAQASYFRIERRQVVFLSWMQDSDLGSLRHQIARKLNAHSQTNWAIEDQAKNFNSIARPYDEQPFNNQAPGYQHISCCFSGNYFVTYFTTI